MRRTGWLAALLLAFTALAPAAVAEDSGNSSNVKDMNILLGLPPCAMTCFLEMRQKAEDNSPCESSDIDCLCSTSSFGEEANNCVVKSCSMKESLLARNLTSTACGLPIRDNSQTYTTIAIVFSVISALAVIQRFAAKFIAENLTIGIDDYMVLLAALMQAPLAAVGVEGGVKSGLGRDIWTLEFQQITDFLYFLYVFTILYFVNITIVKLAFLFFYLRVFPRLKVRRYLWATVAFTCVYGVTFVFAGIFQCQPVSHYWERWKNEQTGKCVNISAVAWANGAIGIAMDLWMIAIPLSQVRKLDLNWKKKAEVAFMFCVGLFVTIMSILRLESLITDDVNSPNATWVKQELAIWSTVEINVGIICACLPSIRSLLVHLFGRKRKSKQSAVEEYRRSKHFGTISRSMADPGEDGMPQRPPNAGIRMERTCAVEYEEATSTASDEARLVRMGDLEMFSSGASSSSSLDKEKEKGRSSPWG